MSSVDPQYRELLPAAFMLFALAIASLTGVFVARFRNLFHWGQKVDSAPISRFGCSLVAMAFLTMGLAPTGVAFGWIEGSIAILVLLGGFILFMIAGAVDFWGGKRR